MVDIRACAVCGRILDYADGRGYFHAASIAGDFSRPELTDHIAVPVRAEEIHPDWRCDFCSAAAPAFILPASDVLLPDIKSGSKGDWLACVDCAQLIERNEWNALVRRVAALFPVRGSNGVPMSEEGTRHLRLVYRKLRAAITGPLRPWDPSEEKE